MRARSAPARESAQAAIATAITARCAVISSEKLRARRSTCGLRRSPRRCVTNTDAQAAARAYRNSSGHHAPSHSIDWAISVLAPSEAPSTRPGSAPPRSALTMAVPGARHNSASTAGSRSAAGRPSATVIGAATQARIAAAVRARLAGPPLAGARVAERGSTWRNEATSTHFPFGRKTCCTEPSRESPVPPRRGRAAVRTALSR
jgi:hypothetical protein